MLLPAGVINLPFGITVFPFLLILVYNLPAGAEMIQNALFSELFWLLQPKNTMQVIRDRIIFFI
jgi:hypothetical protein